MYIWPQDGKMYLNVRMPQPDGSHLRGIGVIEKSGKPIFGTKYQLFRIIWEGKIFKKNKGTFF